LNDRLEQDGLGELKTAYYHGKLEASEKKTMMADFIE
jgi:RecG-like helicase